MPELSKDVIALLQYLVPGFLVAWVFYGFTPYQRPSQFERVVQALVFTVIVQTAVELFIGLFMLIGKFCFSLGNWRDEIRLPFSLFIALCIGFAVAALTRRDLMHRIARRCGLTSRSGYPTEHFAAFATNTGWVALYLKDGTRLVGWPKRWPTEGDKGHYLLENVERSYVDLPNEPAEELTALDGILVSAGDVKIVEFVNQKEAKNGDQPTDPASSPSTAAK